VAGDNFDNVLSGLAGNDTLNGADGADTLLGGAGADNLYGGWGDDTIEGGDGGDYVVGDRGNDSLRGGAGDDVLIGDDFSLAAGSDILDGGAGDDTLQGGGADDIYHFDRGGGFDEIHENDSEGAADKLIFGPGIALADLTVQWNAGATFTDEWGDTQTSSGALWIDIGNDEGVSFLDWNGGTDFEVERFEFADGGSLTLSQLLALDTDPARIGVLPGTSGNDVVQSAGWYDNLYGYNGADLLIGGARSNLIFGGAGSDVLIGRGSIGSYGDSLSGDAGSDLYLFNPGDLKAYLNEAVETGGSDIDTLSFGGGIRPEDLDAMVGFEDYGDGTSSAWFEIRLRSTGETIGTSLQDVYYDDLGNLVTENRRIERIQFLGSGNDQVFNLNGLLTARDAELRAGYDPYNPTFIPLFRPEDLTTYNLTGTVPFAREDLARQYATTGSVPLTPLTSGDITGTAGADTLTGTSGDDLIYGLAGNDTLNGNAGNDLLDGGTGADTMNGGTGNDTYIVDNASDIVTESLSTGGIDTILSSVTRTLGSNQENLTLTGTNAINGTGNSLANVIIGNNANNTLNGGSGNDRMEGGLGDDTYTVAQAGDIVIENPGEGIDKINSSVTYTLSPNVENLTLTGTTAINGTGNSLDNVLIGNSANNTLTGGAGDDLLDGKGGSDTMIGGTGDDTYVVSVSTDIVTENANEGTDTVQTAISYTLGANIENLTLTGSGNAAGTGNTLDNVLTGNTGANTLTGNAGADTLDGKQGNDTLNGGIGSDTYIFNRGYGLDTITDNDTTPGNQDTLDIGVNPLDLVFNRASNNLQLSLHGGTDRLTVNSWYTNTSYQTEVIRANGGRTLLNNQVEQLIQAMAQFSADNGGITWDQAIDQRPGEVEAILAAHWQAA